ncbi:S8 family serine peptidase [Streptomyces sp. OZ13]|uniref:S8 family serine peptidase n=1 Tax=Streptomyces sp. OZ13 TaxID=3452210 RepID=UPI003F8C7858
MRFPPSRRPAVASAAALAVVLATLAAPSAAHDTAPPSRPAPAAADGRSAPPVTVTLITGDKVTVTPGTGGAPPGVSVRRAPGATGSVRVSHEDGGVHVYPDEAVPYIADGRLDKELFDVTGLVAQGYDDAHTASLPLIVTHGKDPEPAPALPGAETTLNLPVIHGKAVRARRSKAAAFWSALTDKNREKREPAFAAGVERVWLDGRARGTLARSTAQIGAPAAWAGGGTGEGVRVAVLDTGVDAAHPDLKDRIVAAKSFVPGEEVTDRYGHGTHTASTAVGTGAASGGTEKGVAPGADLLVGKVLNDRNVGQDSWIIKGMEWAARTEHAKVISMSLGNSAHRGQDNPLSQALNRLSEETGALFVVAAGNDGEQGAYTLGAPGTAEAALTVGSVDGSDELAATSSLGPRQDDDGLKPDLTAPGVDVLAARSQFTEYGEGYYTTQSGTSMATPHVAGAAVLLAQKHPEWTARQLKDALMSTTVPTPRYTPYQAGTGRLSVPNAYYGEVFATGSVDAGLVRHGAERTSLERQITYTNASDAPVTLDLAVEPGDHFSLGAGQITVPAHGTARVALVADPRGLAPGQYSARVTARHNGTPVYTAAGFSVEAERHTLAVGLKDRSGRPLDGYVYIRGAAGGSWILQAIDGKVARRLPPGSYTVFCLTEVEGVNGPHSLGQVAFVEPEVELTGDRTVEFDASRARRIEVRTPGKNTIAQSRIDIFRNWTSPEPVPDWSALYDVTFPSPVYDSLWAVPTGGKPEKGSFAFGTRIRAVQPPLTLAYEGRKVDDALVQPGSGTLPAGTSKLDAVFAGTGTPEEYAGVSAGGKAVVVRGSDTVSPAERAAAAGAAGAAMLLVVHEGRGRALDVYGEGTIPVVSLTRDNGEALIGRIADRNGVRLTLEAHPSPEYLYDLADYHSGGVPEDPSPGTGPGDLARLDLEFAPPAGARTTERRLDYPPYISPGTAAPWPAAAPVAPGPRTDWVSAGDGVSWKQEGVLPEIGTMRTDQIAHEPGSVREDRWFGPVYRPRLLESNRLHRGTDWMDAAIDTLGDGGTAHAGRSGGGTISLYRGDTLLRQFTDHPILIAGELPPEELPYRLVIDTRGRTDITPYSSETHTEWAFTSGSRAEPEAVPLVQLDYGVDLDAEGRAGRGSLLSVAPSVVGGAAESAVGTIEISYDDGRTWTRAAAKEKKGVWRTGLDAPAGAEFVSLRVTAGQPGDGGVTQTVIRAFGLR